MENITKMKSLGDGKLQSIEEIVAMSGIRFRVGCDSLNVKHNTVYITSLVGIYPNHTGAFVFYHKEKIPKIKDIQQRLWREVEIAVAFAKQIRDDLGADIEAIDFDLNIDPQYPSSRLAPSALGFATSEGFVSYVKPDKLYAIWSSDHIVHNSQKKVYTRPHKRFLKIKGS